MFLYTVIVLLFCLSLTASQRKGSLSPTTKNSCIGQRSCGECIAVGKDCAWCQALDYDLENKERCNLLSEHGNCPKEHIVSPNSSISIQQNLPNKDGNGAEDPIQVQPQIIKLNLRPNDPQRFSLTYRVARNYPLDLYYLLDLSHSMLNNKQTLSNLSVEIDTRMKSLTNDFKQGFGSFIDKDVIPYVDKNASSNSVIMPCTECVNTYGYKNHLAMTADPNVFQKKLTDAPISGSRDSPEGGMDGLLQTIVCENQIGWRKLSRKIVLYSTGASSHFAGDGKLGGILKPNDGLCHLDGNGMYTESNMQDYPSLSQIAALLADKSINTLFAVTENQTHNYEQIKTFLIGAEMGKLKGDSSDIVNLITEIYQKISSKVELVTSGANDVVVRYFSRCKDSNGPLMETKVCNNLDIGDSIWTTGLEVMGPRPMTNSNTNSYDDKKVTFEIEVEVNECPRDPASYSRMFNIKPIGLQDNLEVRLELFCKCDCESTEKMNENKQSAACNNHGTLVCGSCSCDDKYYGKTCLCNVGDTTPAESERNCTAKNSNQICSNRGQCVCGKCECKSRTGNSEEKYSGEHCECDDYSCPFYNSALCGGASHGKCQCGTCNCTSSYTGENCGCSTKTDACVDSNGGICGGKGRGQCECNTCKCLEGSDFQGPTCEDCKYCDLVCKQNRACVECVAYGTGELKDDCFECLSRDYITTKSTLPESSNTCEFKDADDCIFYFSYSYDENNELKIVAQQTRECPKKVNVGAIIGGVFGGIVGIVVACLIAWKVFTTLKDRRDLRAFYEEAAKAEWANQENPVFKPATKHYKNPMYKKEPQKVTLMTD